MAVLTVNAGSSSLKWALYPLGEDGIPLTAIWHGSAQGLEPGGHARVTYAVRDQTPRYITGESRDGAHTWASLQLQQGLRSSGLPDPQAIAHRIVHGGPRLAHSVLLDTGTLDYLRTLEPLAPLHQPHNLRGVLELQQAWPGVPHVGCFDTAFHRSIPREHAHWALPAEVRALGVQRYGFHGLSYDYVMQRLRTLSPRWSQRVLMAHLGNGASLCAAKEGRSLATTMGFSTLDGLVMGTRCGALDPGILLYLLERGWTPARLEDLLYRRSGLLGASGLSADLRTLRASSDAGAREAIALLVRSVLHEMGGLAAALQGLDVLTFSAGMGENDATLRAEICRPLAWMGVQLDEERNAQASTDAPVALHRHDSAVEIWLVPTDEGWVAARDAAVVLKEATAK